MLYVRVILPYIEGFNKNVELEKEGGGRRGAEDEEAYPIIIGLISLIKPVIDLKQPTHQYDYSSSLTMLSQVKLYMYALAAHEDKAVVEL